MAKMNIAPTKSNLLSVSNQLAVSKDGYDLLEQKREILVMELMRIVESVKLLEADIDKLIAKAYPAFKRMLLAMGSDQVERISHAVQYDFVLTEKTEVIGGMTFGTLDVKLPQKELFYSFLGTSATSDEVSVLFFELLSLLTKLASIRTVAWRLAGEVKKTQRRVNALDKMMLPQLRETKKYIESVLEERERENVFVLKALKTRAKSASQKTSKEAK